jgi:NADH-quinone oxidoreductase subunit F
MVYEIGGGIPNGKKFKAVQIGGPSGGCLTEEHLDLGLDFDSLQSVGAMVGSGGLVVIDEDNCIVEVARFFMQFIQSESCGKCVACREGTKQMLALLQKIVDGKGTTEDLALLEEVALVVKDASLCGLGKTAANPVLTTMRYFRDEYAAHVDGNECPAGVCKLAPAEVKA